MEVHNISVNFVMLISAIIIVAVGIYGFIKVNL